MATYRRRSDSSGIAILLVLALAAVAALGGVWFVMSGPSPYDGVDTATFCRKEGNSSITVVLIDTTDPLTPQQNERLINELEKVRASIPRFDKIALYALHPKNADGVTRQLVEACNPGSSAEADSFRENAKIVGQKYAKIFDAPFRAALDSVLKSGQGDTSPIIEAIEDATIKTFGKLNNSQYSTRKLIIVSDMVQHTSSISLYRDVPQFPQFQNTDAFKMHRPVLKNVAVEVWEINRSGAASGQRAKIADFWSKYFVAQGGQLSATFWDATKV
jgi:hypothetical protein